MVTYLSSSSLSVVSSSSVVAYRVSLPPASRPTWSGTTASKLLVYFIFYITNFPICLVLLIDFFIFVAEFVVWNLDNRKDAWLIILNGWCYEYLLSIEPYTACQLASMATTGSLINLDVQRYPQIGMEMNNLGRLFIKMKVF